MTLVPNGPPDEQGRQVYKPTVATVTGFSKFNKEQFSLSDIDGFWTLAPKLQQAMGTPVKGAKALWTLSHKPKTDERAKPGSMYCDVIAVGKVPPFSQPGVDEMQDVDDLPLREMPTDVAPGWDGSPPDRGAARNRTESPVTAPTEPQEMSDAHAALFLRLHANYATYLAGPEPRKPWELPMQAQIEAKAIERESIERQKVLAEDTALLVAIYGNRADRGDGATAVFQVEPVPGMPSWIDIWFRRNRLADLLAHLPAAEPLAPEATTPTTTAESLPWSDHEEKK
jgi:hypothetical protein